MGEAMRPHLQDRLRLAESLLRAVEDSLSGLQRLLSEVHKEVGLGLREEIESAREQEISDLRREVTQLREAMVSRAVIERAKGILMQGQGLTESQSFNVLNEMSQRHRRKLRDIAADVASGTLTHRLAVVPLAGAPQEPTLPETRRRARGPDPGEPDRAADTTT
jgi:hypothetical protein